MSNLSGFSKQLHFYQDEILWQMQHMSRDLQNFRDFIQGAWDDSASKKLNAQFFDPQVEYDSEMQHQLRNQLENLANVESKFYKIQMLVEQIYNLSILIDIDLDHAMADLQKASSSYDQFIDKKVTFALQIPVIRNLIESANRAGG